MAEPAQAQPVDPQPAPKQGVGCWAPCAGLKRELGAGTITVRSPRGTALPFCDGCARIRAEAPGSAK